MISVESPFRKFPSYPLFQPKVSFVLSLLEDDSSFLLDELDFIELQLDFGVALEEYLILSAEEDETVFGLDEFLQNHYKL